MELIAPLSQSRQSAAAELGSFPEPERDRSPALQRNAALKAETRDEGFRDFRPFARLISGPSGRGPRSTMRPGQSIRRVGRGPAKDFPPRDGGRGGRRAAGKHRKATDNARPFFHMACWRLAAPACRNANLRREPASIGSLTFPGARRQGFSAMIRSSCRRGYRMTFGAKCRRPRKHAIVAPRAPRPSRNSSPRRDCSGYGAMSDFGVLCGIGPFWRRPNVPYLRLQFPCFASVTMKGVGPRG